MLFQQLYNWIKFKSLPPSILFKNRLFIERNSKYKKIVNNFGLIFRNSKWTNYEMFNIKLIWKNKYVNFFFKLSFFILLIIFLFFFSSLYVKNFFFNTVFYFFWFIYDIIDYYSLFFVWMLLVWISMCTNLIYSYFFFNNLFFNKNVKKIFSASQFKNYHPTDSNKHFDINKYILYFWIKNSKHSNSIIEKVFNEPFVNCHWNKNYQFFFNLYKVHYYLNLLDMKNTYQPVNYSNKNIFIYFSNLLFLNNYNSLIIFFLLSNKISIFKNNNNSSLSLELINNVHTWNIFRINKNLKNSSNFFLTSLNFNKILNYFFSYHEFDINKILFSGNSIAKNHRWLYKYSILHRKILKNSHKITLIKNISKNTPLYGNLSNKNIWISNWSHYFNTRNIKFNFSPSFSFFPSYLNNFKNQFYRFSEINNNFNNSFINYESSYFWFLKRFYNFNNLKMNNFKYYIINSSQNNFCNFEFLNNKNTFNNYCLDSLFLTIKDFTFILFNNNNRKTDFFLNHDFNFFTKKDLFLYFDNEEFLNISNLLLLYWINTKNSNLFINNSINFFDNNVSEINIFEEKINYLPNFNFNFSDSLFINDLLFLNLLLTKWVI
jgi:hypothetical protein